MPSHSTKYEKNMNKDTPDHYLMDKVWSKQMMKKRIGKHYEKDMKSLYHGKVDKTGNSVSFSEKKTRRMFRVNVFCKKHYSEI